MGRLPDRANLLSHKCGHEEQSTGSSGKQFMFHECLCACRNGRAESGLWYLCLQQAVRQLSGNMIELKWLSPLDDADIFLNEWIDRLHVTNRASQQGPNVENHGYFVEAYPGGFSVHTTSDPALTGPWHRVFSSIVSVKLCDRQDRPHHLWRRQHTDTTFELPNRMKQIGTLPIK